MKPKELPYGYGLSFRSLFGIYVRKLNLRKSVILLFLAGLIPGFLYSLFHQPFSTKSSNFIDFALFSMIMFLWGCPGFLFVFRKEALVGANVIVRGNLAVFIGIIILILCWGLGICSIYQGVLQLFG